jgi:hypothetical protein
MNCFLSRFASFWDSPRSRKAAESHARRCPGCASRHRRDAQLSSRLKSAAGGLPDVHEFTVRRSVTATVGAPAAKQGTRQATRQATVQATGQGSGQGSGQGRGFPVWTLPLLSGAVAATLVLVLVGPQHKAHPAVQPEQGLVQMTAGANRIAGAFSSLPGTLKLQKFSALTTQIPEWETPAVPAAAPTRIEQLRETVDPFGFTDSQKWKPVKAMFGS